MIKIQWIKYKVGAEFLKVNIKEQTSFGGSSWTAMLKLTLEMHEDVNGIEVNQGKVYYWTFVYTVLNVPFLKKSKCFDDLSNDKRLKDSCVLNNTIPYVSLLKAASTRLGA
jgi:hypothetical protein